MIQIDPNSFLLAAAVTGVIVIVAYIIYLRSLFKKR